MFTLLSLLCRELVANGKEQIQGDALRDITNIQGKYEGGLDKKGRGGNKEKQKQMDLEYIYGNMGILWELVKVWVIRMVTEHEMTGKLQVTPRLPAYTTGQMVE